MSVLNRKPYVQSVLGSLTDAQTTTLATLIDGASETLFRSFVNVSYPITASDKGVAHCVLETKDKVFTGYLVFNNTYCVLFAYNDNQEMDIVKIDYENDKYELVNEELNITEFRACLEERKEGQDVDGIVEGIIGEKGVPVAIKVDDITELTRAQLDVLKNGDLVLKHLGNGEYATYVVSDCKKNGKIHLTYADNEKVENVVYTKVAQNWGYTSTTTQALNHANVLGYLTTAPESDNTDGLKVVVLTSEPATKYAGYIYLITEA